MRSTSVTDEPNGDMPLWARVLFRYGIVGAIALYLVWQGTQGFGKDLSTVLDEQRIHSSETAFFLRAICLNTATTDTQRALCIPPKP